MSNPMIGRFRHRVVLKAAPETVQGPGGTLTETEAIIGEAWAKIEPVSGQKTFEFQRLHYPVTHRVRVRYVPARMAARTLHFGDRVFQIHSAHNLNERSTHIEYMAEEQDP